MGVPLELPDNSREYFQAEYFVAGGGATEASIWSNWFQVEEVDPEWLSIPYGIPMPNQHMYLLSEGLEHVEAGEAGEILIGGVGLAQGYWRDISKTSEKFIIHPDNGMPSTSSRPPSFSVFSTSTRRKTSTRRRSVLWTWPSSASLVVMSSPRS